MPCDYRIDPARRVVFSRASGVLTEDELRGHRIRLGADPAFDASVAQLFDFSDVTDPRVTPAFFRQRAATGEIFDKAAKRAFVAPTDAVYGNARAFLSWLGDAPHNIRLFRDMAAAREWLGLDTQTGGGQD